MQNINDGTTPADDAAESRTRGEYKVGYRKPPPQHRFKRGNNANPRGRKKGTRNRKLVIQEVLFELVTVREGGEVRQMPALEALLKKLLAKGLGGDAKATLAIIGLAQREGLLTPEQEQEVENLSESDRATMEDYRRRQEAALRKQLSEGSSPPGSV